jgi:hypothetical protein
MPPRRKKKSRTKTRGSRSSRRGKAVPQVRRGLKKGKRSPSPRPPKRPWYERLKDPAERAHWRVTADKWAEDQAREAAEREILADKERAFQVVKWHQGLKGRGARLLSAVVGRGVYEAAEVRYGGNLLKRAALKLEAIRKDREKIRKVALSKISGALKAKGFTMQEVECFQLRVHPRIKLRVRHFFSIRRGKYKGQFEEVEHRGTGRKRIRIIKTRRGLEAAKVARLHRKRAAEVANQLGLTFTQARSLVREVEIQAVIDLRKLRKTKAFKDLPKRKQAAYTEKRWKAGSVAVLYALADIEGYR